MPKFACMKELDAYLSYIKTQKRYSPRTAAIYDEVLRDFYGFASEGDENALKPLTRNMIRAYQIYVTDEKKYNPRTVNLHLSVLSGYCSFLVKKGLLKSNPVSTIIRPKQPARLPVFYKQDAMEHYIARDNALTRRDFELDFRTEEERKETYDACLDRIIVLILYSCGIRRAEIIGLRIRDFDLARKKIRVTGKGDKMREIPLVDDIIQEILLYLHSVELLVNDADRSADSPLLLTYSGSKLYPVRVDRAVKKELGQMGQEFSARKSPHALRHTFATGLMEDGADINSIKEVLGHANLAATQVYTHSTMRQLKQIYESAHPRATNKGGKNGD